MPLWFEYNVCIAEALGNRKSTPYPTISKTPKKPIKKLYKKPIKPPVKKIKKSRKKG